MQQGVPSSFSQKLNRVISNTCSRLANYLECDRGFKSFGIVPHQITMMADDHITAFKRSNPTYESIGQFYRDDSAMDHSQAGRWDQLTTFQWWRALLCCQYSDQMLESSTAYEEQTEIVEESSEKGVGYAKPKPKYADNFATAKMDDTQIHDQCLGIGNRNGLISLPSDMGKDTTLSELNPHTIKVIPKNMGRPVVPVATKVVQQKSVTRSSYINNPVGELQQLQRELDQSAIHQRNNSMMTVSEFDSPLFKPKHLNGSTLHPAQDFDQLELNLFQSLNPRKDTIDSSNTGILDGVRQAIQNDNLGHTIQTKIAPQTISTYQDHKKKKARNLFEEDTTEMDQIQATDEQPPEDLNKKKRNRRRNLPPKVNQEQNWSEPPVEEDLDVIIYTNGDDD